MTSRCSPATAHRATSSTMASRSTSPRPASWRASRTAPAASSKDRGMGGHSSLLARRAELHGRDTVAPGRVDARRSYRVRLEGTMRHVRNLLTGLAVLWAGVAAAEPWRVYLALQTGLVLDHVTGVRAKGGALQAYAAVEAPMGISLGVVAEGAETWGSKLLGQEPLELDYRSLGGEVRLRFLRDWHVNPWAGL